MPEQNFNNRFDDITYEKGWRSASSPEVYVPPKQTELPVVKAKKRAGAKIGSLHKAPFKFLLLTIQLVICALVLAAALVFRQIGGESYEELKTIYFEQLNNSIFETPAEDILDLSEIFGSQTKETQESTETPSEFRPQQTNPSEL